jgi:hypothetical protein
LYHSTSGLRVIKKKKDRGEALGGVVWSRGWPRGGRRDPPALRSASNEFSCPFEKASFAELTYFPPGVASLLGHHDVIPF